MASIVSCKNGRRRIQFTDAGGIRRTIRLGKLTLRQAEVVKTKVETIVGDLITGRQHEE